jgi:hypothetical protein
VTRAALAPRAGLGALLSCALLLPLLPGCTLYNRVFHRNRDPATCRERPFIGNTDSRPPLTVPEGMSAPDTRNAIKIPQLPAAPADPSKTEPCLAQPPPFYAKPAVAKPGSPAPPTVPANSPALPQLPAAPTPPAAPTSAPPAAPTSVPAPDAPAAPGAAAPGAAPPG